MLKKQFFVSIINSYKHFFIIAMLLMSFLYWDNINHYPNSIIEHYKISSLYSFFDYTHDYVREKEALEYAKSNGQYYEAKFLIDMGFKFLKPVVNLCKFFALISSSLILLFVILCIIG